MSAETELQCYNLGRRDALAECREVIEQLRASLTEEFERGKAVGRMIGWDAAKRDTSRALGLDGSPEQKAPEA
jgi:hypothetical protein